jgi:two-component system phosphate regulon response regulator PhoB
MSVNVLLVEDEPSLAELLAYNIEAEGYSVRTADSAEEAELLISETTFDLMVLDWMLPGASGLELCRRLRQSGKAERMPVLMLTSRGEEADRVRGFATGADDYVVKPFSVPELMARIKALLRRSSPERVADTLKVGPISLDRAGHRVTRAGRAVDLGPTEYRLLEALLENPGRVLSRGQLIDRVWGNASEVDERTVDVHVGRLRKALIRGRESDPIRTVRGAGYAIEPLSD